MVLPTVHDNVKISSIMDDCEIPQHVAIIMDGNSRWAAARGLPRIVGHRAGAQAVKRSIEFAIEKKIRWLTLYAFSSENWQRTPEEVSDLTGLLKFYLKSEVKKLHKQNIRIRIIGDITRFDQNLQNDLHAVEYLTKNNDALVLTLALSYGGRGEVIQAVKRICQDRVDKLLDSRDITEDLFASYLFTADIPDPDLILRTSGESRLSNFLLWQAAYAELIFIDTLWPDFDKKDFDRVIDIYIRRERRFGARPGLEDSE